MKNPFLSDIKETFFGHKGRFSRETFAVAFAILLLFAFISSPLLYKLCNLFLPVIVINLMAMAYVGGIIYAMIVLCIKRLHDFDVSGWLSVLVTLPGLNLLFIAYLCFRKGDPGGNSYGYTIDYSGPALLLFICYGLLCFYAAMMGLAFSYRKKLGFIENTGTGVQKIINILPETAKEELKNNPKAMGAVFINNQFTTVAVTITKNRVLIRGIHLSKVIKVALLEHKMVEVRFPDDSKAHIVKFVTSNDSLSVQMVVFEIDKPIGVPATLREGNRKLLEEMNAF